MAYSDDDIRELCLETDKILISGDRYNDKVASLEDLQNRLRRKAKFKEIDFQSKCEGDNSLGDLLLKHAAEDDNLRVKDFLLNNGFTLPQQEQITAAVNEEEGQSTPDVEENKVETSSADSDNSRGIEFTLSYGKVKEIVTNNPNITAEEFGEELKKEEIDIKITNQDGWTLLYYAVRSEGPYITSDRSIFLNVVKLLTNSGIKVNGIQDTTYTLLNRAVITKQADIVKILLESGKFNEEEKLQALNSAIVQGNAQEAQSFLGHIKYEEALGVLNTLKTTVLHGEKVEGMRQFFECNKDLTEEEKVKTLSDAVMENSVPRVKLFLEHMVSIPEASIGSLLEIMKQRQSSLKKEDKPCLKTNAIIRLLELAINKKKEEQSTKENGAASSSNIGDVVSTDQTDSLNIDNDVKDLYESIDKTLTLG